MCCKTTVSTKDLNRVHGALGIPGKFLKRNFKKK